MSLYSGKFKKYLSRPFFLSSHRYSCFRKNFLILYVTFLFIISLFLLFQTPILTEVFGWTYETIWWLGHSPTATEDQSSGYIHIYYTYPTLVYQNEIFDVGISLEYIKNDKVVTNWLMFNNVSVTLRNYSSPENIISHTANKYKPELVKPGESYSHIFSFVAPDIKGKYLIFPQWLSWFGPGTTVLDNFDWKMEYYYNQTQREFGIVYPKYLPPITVVKPKINKTNFTKMNDFRILGLELAKPYNQIANFSVPIENTEYKTIVNLGDSPKNISLPYGSSYNVTFPKFIDIIPGQIRAHFFKWSDGQSFNQNNNQENEIELKGNITREIAMDSNKELFGLYKTQYKLDVISPNNLGNPEGTDWYDSEAQALFSVNTLEGLKVLPIPKSFDRWTGDIAAGTSDTVPSGHMEMDGPKKLITNWKYDYTLVGIGLGIVGSAIGIFEFVRRLYSSKKN